VRRSPVVAVLLACSVYIAMAYVGTAFAQETFCGKYRGVVTKSLDPLLSGRVEVLVPDVSAIALWALPAVPFGQPFSTPSIGQKVWVEYEACEPTAPIWTGGFEARCVIQQRGDQHCTLIP